MKTRAALSAVLLLAFAPCEAQVKIQVEGGGLNIKGGVILNGGRLIINGEEFEGGDRPEGAGPKAAAGATAQVLEFADGSRLHGTLEKIDGAKKELIWSGLDASGLLTLPLGQISRWDAPASARPEVKVRATVKLSGGDWLAADLTEIARDKVLLKLGDGTPLSVERARVEWIHFSKTAAAECYDGPLSMAGWASDGNWTYREGALRTVQPTAIGRMFEALPDQVEYRFEFDQGGNTRAFAVLLHGTEPAARGFRAGMVRIMINDSNLQLWVHRQDQMKQEQVDLSKILPARAAPEGGVPPKLKPMRWRIFEDRPAGRLVVFIDGRKVADWKDLGKTKEGDNRGSLTFQPMAWGGDMEQVVSKIRVLPWDGFVPVDDAIEHARPTTDQLVMTDGDRNAGRIESATTDKVVIGSETVARDKVAMIRFARPPTPPDEDPPIGRVRLAHRGEIEVTSLAFQDGKLRARTHFGGEMVLPLTGLRGLEFAHLAPLAGKPADVLLFNNGDQLRGALGLAASGQKLRWHTAPETPAVELDVARLAGVLLSARPNQPEGKTGVLTRCRNGDLLAGNLVALDKERLTLESGAAGRLAIPRERLRAIYFSHAGKLPVLDGAADREVWEAGLDFNRGVNQAARAKKAGPPRTPGGRWAYFDGAFSVKRHSRAMGYNDGNLNLGRIVEGMPARVEFSFDVAGKKNQIFFSAHLFSEPGNPGYMMQLHPGGLFIYDTGSQQRRQAQQNVQIQFGDKVKTDALQYRLRILADRPSGRMTVFINDVNVASFGPKSGAPPRNLGTGLGLLPQQNMACVFSNLWVAPWNGELPGTAPSAAVVADSVLLANGDEAQGKIGDGTPDKVQLESELGPIDLPVSRLTAIEFGGSAPEPAEGVRVRLSDRSVLTVSAYRIEKDAVVCQSPVLGEIKLPLAAVRELVFGRLALPLATNPGEKAGTVREGLLIRH